MTRWLARTSALAGRESARKLRYLVLGAVVSLSSPCEVAGHGVELLLARLELKGGQVRVEVTADCEDNWLLPDEEAARAAMNRLFQVSRKDQEDVPWTRLAPLRFEERAALDPAVPLPPDPTWDGRAHQLLTAIWEWRPPAGEAFQFAVPKGEPMDTLLWQAPADAAEPVRWKVLIAGDRTEWFGPLTGGLTSSWIFMGLGLLLAVSVSGVWLLRRDRTRFARAKAAG